MKNTFKNIAAIIKFNDDDIRVIQDNFVKFPKKFMHNLTSDHALYEFVKFSNDPSAAKEFDIKLMLQILANAESDAFDIKEMNYVDGNILFTIKFEDDLAEGIRYCINDVKCFRKYHDMNNFLSREVTQIHWESLCSRVLKNKSLNFSNDE